MSKRQPIASPCINRCQVELKTGWCEGCLRTIEEITDWARMGEAARQAVWSELPARRAQRDALKTKTKPKQKGNEP